MHDSSNFWYGHPQEIPGERRLRYDRGSVLPRWSAALNKDGVVVTVNPIIGKLLPRFLTKMLGINRLESFFVEPDATGLSRLAELIASGRLTPQIEAAFPLDEAAKAQQMSESGRVRGKIVLTDSHVKV